MSDAATALPLRELVYVASECTIGFLAVVFNSLVVLVIVRKQVLHTATNAFICSLGLADICVGLFVTPSSILTMYGVPGNFYGCLLTSCVAMVFTNVSILMLLTIALDRFFAIKEPFVYHNVMTMHKAYFISGGMWVIGANAGLIPFYGWHKPYQEMSYCRFTDVIHFEFLVYFQFFSVILPSMIIMFMSYSYIWIVVMRQMRVIDNLNRRFATASEVSLARRWYIQDVKASKMIVLALALFLCRTPLKIMNCINLVCKTCNYPYVLLMGFILLSHFNSVINPILYALSNSAIRQALTFMIQEMLCPGEELQPHSGLRSSTFENSSHREVPCRSIASFHAETAPLSDIGGTEYVTPNERTPSSSASLEGDAKNVDISMESKI